MTKAVPRSFPQGYDAVEPPVQTAVEAKMTRVVEDAAAARIALHLQYFSANRSALEWRYVSVQRILPGPPVRFVAVCHRTGTLKWFRVEAMAAANLDSSEPFIEHEREKVDDLLAQSIDGYHDGIVRDCSFVVRMPEAAWVVRNLPGPMKVTYVDGGIRVSTSTAGGLRLARFVVGLGDAAVSETPELRAQVEVLALGALRGPPLAKRASPQGEHRISRG
jgi:hypothetical protein